MCIERKMLKEEKARPVFLEAVLKWGLPGLGQLGEPEIPASIHPWTPETFFRQVKTSTFPNLWTPMYHEVRSLWSPCLEAKDTFHTLKCRTLLEWKWELSPLPDSSPLVTTACMEVLSTRTDQEFFDSCVCSRLVGSLVKQMNLLWDCIYIVYKLCL